MIFIDIFAHFDVKNGIRKVELYEYLLFLRIELGNFYKL